MAILSQDSSWLSRSPERQTTRTSPEAGRASDHGCSVHQDVVLTCFQLYFNFYVRECVRYLRGGFRAGRTQLIRRTCKFLIGHTLFEQRTLVSCPSIRDMLLLMRTYEISSCREQYSIQLGDFGPTRSPVPDDLVWL